MKKTKMILILGIVFIVLMAVMGIVIFIMIRRAPKSSAPADKTLDTAQDFLPFEDIKDSVLHLGDFKYRAILETEGINYDLKTNKEKEVIDASYQRFLDSLTFQITFFIQTRTVDNATVLETLENDMVETVKEYPQLHTYATVYLQEMAKLSETIGNDKQKKKYIIIPYEDAMGLTYSSEGEKYEESIRGLSARCQLVMDGLASLGVKTKILSSIEIAELIYSTYHRDNSSDIDQIVNGEYMSLIVDGPNSLEKITRNNSIEWMLSELENRLRMELSSQDINSIEQKKMSAVLEKIAQLKKAVTK